MRTMAESEIRAFLTTGTRTGKLATVREDGRPHVVPVWFVHDGDELVFTTWHASVKAGNLDRTGRAALSVDLEEPPYAFVTVEGPVSISEDPDELLHYATRIGARYMGSDRAEEFGRRNAVDGEWVVKLHMQHVVAQDGIAG
jgi:PPOX class probable F420-dependent enzyme